MHKEKIADWRHSHTFGQERKRPGEQRTLIVIAITGVMMVVEILTGILYGSMALLADGLHMASHAFALGITAFAYYYARSQAGNPRFSFGTGKVNALGGFTGAVLLAGFATVMVWESIHRFIQPVPIEFNQAILVAVIGLIVNGACVFILEAKEEHGHSHSHDGDHSHHHHHHHDHNLKSAYLHVMADALTSLLAIVALLAAKYFGLMWMDPMMGVIGAVLVVKWSISLLKNTSGILLDHQASQKIQDDITKCMESDGDTKVTDLHVWSIGPNINAAVISVVAHGQKSPGDYKKQIPNHLGLVHVSVEVHPYD